MRRQSHYPSGRAVRPSHRSEASESLYGICEGLSVDSKAEVVKRKLLRFDSADPVPSHSHNGGATPHPRHGSSKANVVRKDTTPCCASNISILAPSEGAPPALPPNVKKQDLTLPGCGCAGNAPAKIRRRSDASVHPRVCGERDDLSALIYRRSRFIPACAGNSCVPLAPRSVRQSVHPRVCGEQPSTRDPVATQRRFIPACAGNTLQHRPQGRAGGRFIPACAGNSVVRRLSQCDQRGSSPRARGTAPQRGEQASRLPVHPRVRGEHPGCVDQLRRRHAVHPRVRGEQLASARRCRTLDRSGSSPRARGTLRAGGQSNAIAPVHPRVRGERVTTINAIDLQQRFIPACAGNTALPSRCLSQSKRFIPACAGNTLDSISAPGHWSVHPRVCGEHAARQRSCSNTCGSSPRARGTQTSPGYH